MKRATVIAGALLALGLVATARPAAAQATIGWDVGLFSSYVWRGLTYTSRPVVQPDLYVTIPLSAASLTAGLWANIEPGKYNGTRDISEGGGVASPDLAEWDWWAEIGGTAGLATLTAGATGYQFPNDAGLTKIFNTTEVYGKVALAVPSINPKASVYYDVDKVKGAYFEGSVSHGFPLTPAVPFNIGVTAGLSEGQEINTSKPGEFYNFAMSGLTHVDLAVSSSFAAGPLSIAPALHLVYGHDRFTKFSISTTHPKDFKLWGGATISWSHALGAAAKE